MTETVEAPEFTKQDLEQAMQHLVNTADGAAQMHARVMSSKGQSGRAYAIINYPEQIPPLHRAAVAVMQQEGMEAGISDGRFLNSIMFPGREVIVRG